MPSVSKKMKYQHHQLTYEINDDWLAEAGANAFAPSSECYRANPGIKELFLVSIDSVEPLTARAKSIGIFCNDKESGSTARERVVRILRWFVADSEVEPVRVVPLESGSYKYKLVAGCHRFYCAHAVGFKKVPAVIGFDISTIDA